MILGSGENVTYVVEESRGLGKTGEREPKELLKLTVPFEAVVVSLTVVGSVTMLLKIVGRADRHKVGTS